jgi:hypothetical protein
LSAHKTPSRRDREQRVKALVAAGKGHGGKTTHGAIAFRDSGILPEGAEHVQAALEALRQGYTADLGGEAELTTAQRKLLDLLVTADGMRMLIEVDLARRGLTSARGRVRASTHLLLALIDREQRLCKELGLKRVPRKVEQTIAEWIEVEQGKAEDDDAA